MTTEEIPHGVTSRESVRKDAPGLEWWWRCSACGMHSRPTTDDELSELLGTPVSAEESARESWSLHENAHSLRAFTLET